jgi:sigma-B regulation protein RsbU (phosphoserine phosphatase)
LTVKDKVIGVAEVINRIDGKAFDNDDLELFSTFSRQVAMAIENARMYQVKLEKQRLEQELESARFIQESFMPEEFLGSADDVFSLSAKYLPAKSVGGDFYDFIEFDSHVIGIAVGDVTGKGVPAALYMARLVSDFRLFTKEHADPSDVLKSLNDILVERSRRGMFVTFQYGVLDADSGEFVFGNAGHLPFIHIKAKEQKVDLLQGGKTIPLGIAGNLDFTAATVKLDHGDMIICVTDGIIEAKNTRDEIYSLQRTLSVLSQTKGTSGDIVTHLLDDVQEFARGSEQNDDLTILAMQFN